MGRDDQTDSNRETRPMSREAYMRDYDFRVKNITHITEPVNDPVGGTPELPAWRAGDPR